MITRHVTVLPYDDAWAQSFIAIKAELREALGELALGIEHVGSTSVKGLSAKPVIDIDVVIKDHSAFDAAASALRKIGYQHEGDLGIPGREAFRYDGKAHLQKHHLYVCPQDSPELKRHIAFRDFLRSHPDVARKYGQIKEEGAALYPNDIDGYIAHKATFIEGIYRKIGVSRIGRWDGMIDGHIHIERGPYTLDWINRFVDRAVETRLDEIWLLEHCYRFEEFVPMYASVCAHSEYVNAWFHRKAGILKFDDYLELIRRIRGERFPVKVRFGLEICYFKEFERFTAELTRDKGFDFLLGSVHFVDDFAFDHKAEHWAGMDVDRLYRRYFEDSVSLAESGLFDGIGHPDAIKLFGHRPSYPLSEYYERLAAALAKADMYADQNSGAARRCPDTAPLGMDAELLRALKRHGVRIVTSSDAHRPEDVGYKIRELNDCILNC